MSTQKAGSTAVLIVKLGAIGDVVMALPAVHALAARGAAIDWVCGSAVAPLLACYPWIRPIVVDERAILKGSAVERVRALWGLWRAIAGRRYDLCATLYYDPRYRVVALPVRAARRLTLSKTERSRMLLPGRHHTDEYARILLELGDGERPTAMAPVRPGTLPESPLPRIAGGLRVILVPGGARNLMRDDALRRWPVESYVEVARQLTGRGMEVFLVGGAEDVWVLPHFSGLETIDLIGQLSLLQSVALMDQSDVVVTHDTGPLHLAGLTRAGVVSIFGPTDPRGRLPQRANTVAIWGGEGFACRPCYDGVNFAACSNNGCMQQVKPEMVVREIDLVIEQRLDASRPPRIVTPMSRVVAER